MALKTENKENAILKEENKKNEEITNFDPDLKNEAEEASKLFGVKGLNPVKEQTLYNKPESWSKTLVNNQWVPSPDEVKRIDDYWNSPERLNEKSFNDYSDDDLVNRYNNIVSGHQVEDLDNDYYWDIDYVMQPEMYAIVKELGNRKYDTSKLKPSFGRINVDDN